MSINVLIFASLSEQLGLSETKLDAASINTALDVWQALTSQQADEAVRVAINQEYADFSSTVKSGDEVAFFPPVTGG